MLKVSEIFASIQGEGPNIGKPAVFLRLAGCNLDCSWCDTRYALGGGYFHRSVASVNEELVALIRSYFTAVTPLVVITGGEPLLQKDELSEVVVYLKRRCADIEIETNGTVAPPFDVTYNVSPKLSNAGIPPHSGINLIVLDEFVLRTNATFKFVCCNPDDLDDVDDIVRKILVDHARVIIQPEGVYPETQLELLKALVDPVRARGYRLLPRLHTLIWGARRGV